MTLSDKLQLINTYKGDIRTSIANKGVDIPSTTPLSEYSSKIDNIDTALSNFNVASYRSVLISPDGTMSNFNTYSAIGTPRSFTLGSNWEIGYSFTATSFSTEQRLVAGYDYRLHSGLSTDGQLQIWFGTGSKWDIASTVTSSFVCQTNTKYYVKYKYDGSNYTVEISTDNVSFETIITISSSTTVGNMGQLWFGCLNLSSGILKPLIYGSIGLKDCYVKIDDTELWRGAS